MKPHKTCGHELAIAEIVSASKLEPLIRETGELLAILTTIVTKIKKRMGK